MAAQAEHRLYGSGVDIRQEEFLRTGLNGTADDIGAVGIEVVGIDMSVGVDEREWQNFIRVKRVVMICVRAENQRIAARVLPVLPAKKGHRGRRGLLYKDCLWFGA